MFLWHQNMLRSKSALDSIKFHFIYYNYLKLPNISQIEPFFVTLNFAGEKKLFNTSINCHSLSVVERRENEKKAEQLL